MKATKCSNCGLVNLKTDSHCRRCKKTLIFTYPVSQSKFAENVTNKVNTENEEGSEIWFVGVGILFVILGIILVVWNWSSAMNEGTFGGKSLVIAPVGIAAGLKFIIQKSAKDTPFWIFLQILAAIIGVLNFLYFKGYF